MSIFAFHRRSILTGASMLGAVVSAVAQESPEQGQAFDTTVAPFLEQHCYGCHGRRKPKAGVNLRGLSASMAVPADAELWSRALAQLQAGLMPPLKKKRPAVAAQRRVMQWIESGVLASPIGSAHRSKMALPSYGNWVDHHSLFSGAHDEPPFTRARLWRHSPYIFAARRRVDRRVKGVQNPFAYSTPPKGIRDYAPSGAVGASVIETSLLNAASEIDWLFAEASRAREGATDPRGKKRRRQDPLAPFMGAETRFTEAQMAAAIEPTFARVIDRSPTDPEIRKYVGLLQRNLADTGDPKKSLRGALTAIYLSPEAIYRMEWGLGPVDEHGRRMLSPDELAYAVSYALFDTGPGGGRRGQGAAFIAEARRQNRLATKGDVARVVDRILSRETYRPAGGRRVYGAPRLMRFFREFFGFQAARDVFKDDQRVREHGLYHNPRRLIIDAENLIASILRADQNVFERLLTTNQALIFHDGDNQAPIARWEQARRDLASVDESWARAQTERRLKGVAKKPKYRNNPKLLERTQAKIRAEEGSLVRKERRRLQALVDLGPHMERVKARERRYLWAYNLSPKTWKWPAVQPFELPKTQRAGILTHPAWLVAHSGNDDTDPIHRGIWVYEKLLAGVIADVPPTVDASIPEDPHKTLRERMQPLRADACWTCHRKINPLGEPFECFDDFGRFRTRFYFDEKKNILSRSFETVPAEKGTQLRSLRRDEQVAQGRYTTRPVDATGSFEGLGIPGLEGEFDGAVEMMHRIARSDRARQSILRHMFRFFLGRNETLQDSRTLREADQAYRESGGSFRAVVVSLLSSDSFLYRR